MLKYVKTAILVAGLFAVSMPALAADSSPSDLLVGTWQLITPEGVVVTPSQFTSQIIFSKDGTMAVQSMAPDPEASSPYMRMGYEAYYGTYTVNEKAGTVTFKVESALARALIGQDLERFFKVSKDQLKLDPTNPEEAWSVTYQRR